MTKRITLTWLLVFALVFSLVALAACHPNTPEIPNGGDEEIPGQVETKYTLSFVGGEGATGEAPASITCKAGTVISLPQNTFSNEGYVFAGWSDGTETYKAGSLYTAPATDTVLTAVWQEASNTSDAISSVVLKDMILTVSGTTGSESAVLFVGEEPTDDSRHNFYTDISIAADGSFTVSFDLNTLVASNDWYNVYVFLADESYMIVSLNDLSNGEGGSYELWSWIALEENNLQICSWDANGTPTLSFKAEKQPTQSSDYFLKGGQISANNKTVAIAEENGKVYFTFSDEFVGSSNAKTFELIFTTADPEERPASVDKVLFTAQNVYEGDNVNAFSFKVNLTDDIGYNNDWVRFVLKVTEGDTVSYYTIKPLVPSHNGDWIAFCDPIIVDGLKHELAICWSSVFVQVK